MELTPDQPIAEGNQSTFNCTAPGRENITSYIWKLNDALVPDENTGQYSFEPTDVRSEKSQVTLQVFCK